MRFGGPRSDCLRLVPYICSRLLQIHREDVAGCARYADQPEINTGGIREEDNGALMKAKLGRQKKFNQEKRVQSQSIPMQEKDSSIDSDPSHTASNIPSLSTRWNCNFTQRCKTERFLTDCLKTRIRLKGDFLK